MDETLCKILIKCAFLFTALFPLYLMVRDEIDELTEERTQKEERPRYAVRSASPIGRRLAEAAPSASGGDAPAGPGKRRRRPVPPPRRIDPDTVRRHPDFFAD